MRGFAGMSTIRGSISLSIGYRMVSQNVKPFLTFIIHIYRFICNSMPKKYFFVAAAGCLASENDASSLEVFTVSFARCLIAQVAVRSSVCTNVHTIVVAFGYTGLSTFNRTLPSTIEKVTFEPLANRISKGFLNRADSSAGADTATRSAWHSPRAIVW